MPEIPGLRRERRFDLSLTSDVIKGLTTDNYYFCMLTVKYWYCHIRLSGFIEDGRSRRRRTFFFYISNENFHCDIITPFNPTARLQHYPFQINSFACTYQLKIISYCQASCYFVPSFWFAIAWTWQCKELWQAIGGRIDVYGYTIAAYKCLTKLGPYWMQLLTLSIGY